MLYNDYWMLILTINGGGPTALYKNLEYKKNINLVFNGLNSNWECKSYKISVAYNPEKDCYCYTPYEIGYKWNGLTPLKRNGHLIKKDNLKTIIELRESIKELMFNYWFKEDETYLIKTYHYSCYLTNKEHSSDDLYKQGEIKAFNEKEATIKAIQSIEESNFEDIKISINISD